jgi:flavin reductase (DIM6/NTAB) family NADH-FMN oxidoreductase RutF
MRQVASTVVVVTSYVSGRPWGTTISGFMSVSVEPPLCLVSLLRETVIWSAVAERGHFGVSVLPPGLSSVARLASAPGRPKYIDMVCTEASLAGAWDCFVSGRSASVGGDDPAGRDPEVAGAIAHLDCDVYRSVTVADHELVIGRVIEVSSGSGRGDPLLYLAGEYRQVGDVVNDGGVCGD